MTAIYTIGYGHRNIDDFIKLLKLYQIAYLIDVRSQPYSKSNPEFASKLLEKNLSENGIRYVFMGEALGGRPADRSCYDENDKVLYEKVQTMPFYQAGIERLINAWKQNLPVVLMCSELRPEECHRSKLIGATLHEQQIEVIHIDEKGELKSQEAVANELRAKSDKVSPDQPSLFGDLTPSLKSKKRYRDISKEDSNEN
jgi:uncharacterized protein (DUF488 family)